MPPKKLQSITTESKGALRGLTYDEAGRRLFACCLDDGKVYGYYLGSNIQNDVEVDKLFTIVSEKGCRDIAHIARTDQIVVGHESGIVVVYSVSNPKNPFYSRKVHNKDITKMEYLADCNVLLTASKDQSIKFWKIKHDREDIVKKKVDKPKPVSNPFQNLAEDDDNPFSQDKSKLPSSSKINKVETVKVEEKPTVNQKASIKDEEEESDEEEVANWAD